MLKNKDIIVWTIILTLIGGIILFISLNKNQTTLDVKSAASKQSATSAVADIVKNPVINIIVPSKVVTKSYSASDVSLHNSQNSCWTIISGKIYDITDYISYHPAGVRQILRGCGVDATNMFGRVGAHDVSRLSNNFVGNLK